MFRISVVEPCNGYLCLSAKTHGSPFSIDYYDSYTSEQTDNPFTGEKILPTFTRILLWMLLIEVCEALNSPGAGLCRQHRGVHNTFSKKTKSRAISFIPILIGGWEGCILCLKWTRSSIAEEYHRRRNWSHN